MFFIPLYDENPSKKRPLVTWALIAICFIIFIYQFNLSQRSELNFIYKYAFIPDYLNNYYIVSKLTSLDPMLTLITSAFLHAGWMHILGNMLYLYIFGDNVIDGINDFEVESHQITNRLNNEKFNLQSTLPYQEFFKKWFHFCTLKMVHIAEITK